MANGFEIWDNQHLPRHGWWQAGALLNLCMPRGPAEIFEGDNRFAHVCRKGPDCPHDYDFIILHSIGPSVLRFKLRHPATPFAAMIGHLQGERFARTEFSAIRLGQLLGRPIDPIHASANAAASPPLPTSPAV